MNEEYAMVGETRVRILTLPSVLVSDLAGTPPGSEQEFSYRALFKLQRDPENIVINFTDVHAVNSAVLGQLIAGHLAAAKDGKRLTLCCLRPHLQAMLRNDQLDIVFHIYETEFAAIGSYPTSIII